MSVSYVIEKYGEAVVVLATKPGRVQERLRHAYNRIAWVPYKALAPDLQEEFECLHEIMTRVPSRGEGPVEATTSAMSDEEAETVARGMLDLYFVLLRRYWRPENEE